MAILNKPSRVGRAAVTYTTVGALTVVWSGIWFVYLRNNAPSSEVTFYWCYGFLLTGLTLALIGLTIGWMGRPSVRHAELPHAEVSPVAIQADQTAAPNGRTIVPVGSAESPTVVSNGPARGPLAR